MHEGRNNSVGASKLFHKVINELLAVDVMIVEEDKMLILLSSLTESYDHIITTMLYGKETLFLEEITSTLLYNEIRKMPNQESMLNQIDYRETFSHVSKKDYFCIIMTLVAHCYLVLHQMDMKTTFLNGDSEEEICMKQLEGFVPSDGDIWFATLKNLYMD